LLIRPVQSPSQPWTSAAYNNPSGYRDIDVAIGTAPATLPGSLTLPQTASKVAAVVLVHGSGPHDRNETIGPNRQFQDIAEVLASRGIGLLRYEPLHRGLRYRTMSSQSHTTLSRPRTPSVPRQ
jgi:hypothetical protein